MKQQVRMRGTQSYIKHKIYLEPGERELHSNLFSFFFCKTIRLINFWYYRTHDACSQTRGIETPSDINYQLFLVHSLILLLTLIFLSCKLFSFAIQYLQLEADIVLIGHFVFVPRIFILMSEIIVVR